MSRGPYVPQPGTIPHRVVEHLKTLPPGTELSTPDLLEALDIQPVGPFAAYMVAAIKHGVVASVIRPRGSRQVAHWKLGTGIPLPDPAAEPDDEDDAPPEVLKSAWPFPPRSVFELANAKQPPIDPVGAEELADAIAASVPAAVDCLMGAAPAAEHLTATEVEEVFQRPDDPPLFVDECDLDDEPFLCAIWSDGRLQLQRGAEDMLLTVDETRQLVHYLERMGAEA